MPHTESIHESAATILSRIQFTTNYNGLCRFRHREHYRELEKNLVWQRIDAFVPDHCVMASNTSAISITRIASVTRRPANVLGMHFMNPVPLKSTVEGIRGYHTSDATLATATTLLSQMKMQGIVVQDMPGFVSNRVSMLMVNEAIFLVQHGVATVEQVDSIFRSCLSHKMGPLETADLIAWIRFCIPSKCCTRVITTANTGRARCSKRWWMLDYMDARTAADSIATFKIEK